MKARRYKSQGVWRASMRAVAKANMWWKRREFKDEDVKSVVKRR